MRCGHEKQLRRIYPAVIQDRTWAVGLGIRRCGRGGYGSYRNVM